MIRFFASESDISGGFVRLSAEDAEHIRSLRLRPDELFIVCTGMGLDYTCRLSARDGGDYFLHQGASGGAFAEIVDAHMSRGEPSILCSVYIAHAKGDRLEFAIQKSVELGAHEIVLFPSERCVSIPGDISKRIVRYSRISLETAKQCDRGIVPEISFASSFDAAIEKAACAKMRLFLYEREEDLHLKQALAALEAFDSGVTVSIVTGPEGGFEPREAELAKSAGMTTVTLGPRILRCETAPIAALAAVMYHTGNF